MRSNVKNIYFRSGAILKTPILREKWELNNDDVELLEKIGRGNFGDVYRARLRPGELQTLGIALKAQLSTYTVQYRPVGK